ncbi:MAG: M23 family metallopeptidase [Actinobacteria bacterium]|nr:M23 family metallopeptidase [Actinomycetota bacterium]
MVRALRPLGRVGVAAGLSFVVAGLGAVRAGGEEPDIACGPDYAVAGGHFYSQTAGGDVLGFNVYDDEAATFYSAFRALGGIPALGYPVTDRFELSGFRVQAFQKAILQWDSATNRVNVVNILDNLHDAGFDGRLESERQVPPHATLPQDAGAPFAEVVRNHLAILESNAEIKEKFLSTPEWLARLGLPITYGEYGHVKVLRSQRAVLQQWMVEVPWAKAGQVVFANVGDTAKELGLIPAAAQQPVAPRPPADLAALIRIDPTTPQPGSTVQVTVATGHPGVAAAWGATALPLACNEGQWHGLVGLHSTAIPGAYKVRVSAGPLLVEKAVTVAPRVFPTAEIALPDGGTGLLDPNIAAAELTALNAVWTQALGGPRWVDVFRPPASGPDTSPYGERRRFNEGGVPSVHDGADIAAPTGAPAHAVAPGVVVYAGPLIIRGNMVVIDHGFGVYSAYFHLDRIDVTNGAVVKSGQAIGLVGSTGRSTGPHMHWEVRVLGTAVDPLEWTRRAFPAITGGTAFRSARPPAARARPAPTPAGTPAPSPPAVPAATTPAPTPAPTATGETGTPPPSGPAG